METTSSSCCDRRTHALAERLYDIALTNIDHGRCVSDIDLIVLRVANWLGRTAHRATR